MSFLFNWLDLTMLDIKASINEMLDQTHIPQFPRSITIKSLTIGDKPPTFELLDIIDLNDGKFKGLFKFHYTGELNITLCSEMEINSLRLIEFDSFTKPHFVLSDKSTIIPVDFKLDNLRIDSLLTVVYDGEHITVVFKDEPVIDLDIETSIDELLDDELFEIIKTDTLKMASEFLVQDLPAMIHSLKILDSYVGVDPEVSLVASPILNPSKELKRSISSISLTSEDYITSKMDMNIYDTLSLKPNGFNDVVQRISLSQAEYQSPNNQRNENDLKFKKRRVIKMGSSKKSQLEPPEQEDTPEIDSLDISTDDIISTSSRLEQEPPSLQPDSTNQQEKSPSKQISYTSSPTLFEDTSVNSLDAEFETLVLSNEHEQDNLHNFNENDPYHNLIHPMDILPSFNQLQTELDESITFDEKLVRPRGPSSNYINLNADFKKFSLQDFKTTTAEYGQVFD